MINIRRFIATVGDIGALIMLFVYIAYVFIAMKIGLGDVNLNLWLLGLAFIYMLFLWLKIYYFNKFKVTSTINKVTKKIYKYAKLVMKLVHAVFAAASLAHIGSMNSETRLFAISSILVLCITFTVSIVWELFIHSVKKKLHRQEPPPKQDPKQAPQEPPIQVPPPTPIPPPNPMPSPQIIVGIDIPPEV